MIFDKVIIVIIKNGIMLFNIFLSMFVKNVMGNVVCFCLFCLIGIGIRNNKILIKDIVINLSFLMIIFFFEKLFIKLIYFFMYLF